MNYKKFPITYCITYYNEGSLLTDCLNSIYKQEYVPEEVFIYDDYSNILPDPFIPDDVKMNIRVFRGEKNQGPGYGRNVLLSHVRTDYIKFADCDDTFIEGSGRILATAIKESYPDLVICPNRVIRKSMVLHESFPDFSNIRSIDDIIKRTISQGMLTTYSTLKTEIVRKIGGYKTRQELPQSEDYEFHVRYVFKIQSFSVQRAPLINLNIRENSNSSSNWGEVYISGLNGLKIISQDLPVQYQPYLVEKGENVIYHLIQLGHYQYAKEGIAFLLKLNRPAFKHRSSIFRIVNTFFGWYAAERISKIRNGFKGKQS